MLLYFHGRRQMICDCIYVGPSVDAAHDARKGKRRVAPHEPKANGFLAILPPH